MARKRRKNRRKMGKSTTNKTISIDRFSDLEDCELFIVEQLTSISCDLNSGEIKFLQPEDSEYPECTINMSQVDSAVKLMQMVFTLANKNSEEFTKQHIFDLIHIASLDSYSKERDKTLIELYRGFRHVVLSRDNMMKNHYFWWVERHADELKELFFEDKSPEEIEELTKEGLDPSDEKKCGDRFFSFVGRNWYSYMGQLPQCNDMTQIFQALGDSQEVEHVEPNHYFKNVYFNYSDEDFKTLKKESA